MNISIDPSEIGKYCRSITLGACGTHRKYGAHGTLETNQLKQPS